MRRLVVLLFAVACWWPTRDLPWARTDAPNFWKIATALARLPASAQLGAAVDVQPVLGSLYAGVLNPVIWLAHEACALTVGWDPAVHRLLRLAAFVLLAWWVQSVTRCVTRSAGAGLAAALGFLAFPCHLECWLLLPVYEPIQVLQLVGFLGALWTWTLPRRSGAWLALAWALAFGAVWSKSTSWCLVAPVVTLAVWVVTGRAGRESRRLGRGLAVTALVLGLVLGGYVKAGGGQRRPGAWVSKYKVELGEMSRTFQWGVDELWRGTVLLAPLAAVGLARGRWRGRRALYLLLCAAWVAGATAIFLPWTAFGSRYWLLGSPPLAVVVTAGLHALGRARAPTPLRWALFGALAFSLAWMVLQFAFRRETERLMIAARDGCVQEIVRALAAHAEPGAAIVHACGDEPPERHDMFQNVCDHLETFGGRRDLRFECTALPASPTAPRPAGLPVWLVVTPREDDETEARTRARLRLDRPPVFELHAFPHQRGRPELRYFLYCLRTGRPLVDPGWVEPGRWRVYR